MSQKSVDLLYRTMSRPEEKGSALGGRCALLTGIIPLLRDQRCAERNDGRRVHPGFLVSRRFFSSSNGRRAIRLVER